MEPGHYDAFASDYATDSERNLVNNHYERPAMLKLLSDVRGAHVLDAGCGAGPLAAELAARGATVAGFDSSSEMIAIARRRLGDAVDLQVSDLGRPLPYPNERFDLVAASLVLHYLEDWGPALTELHRVLKPGGRLTISVHHPFVYRLMFPERDYFATEAWTSTSNFNGTEVELTYWHRPLHAMTDAFAEAGFRVATVAEPPFAADTPADLIPPHLVDRTAFLSFIFFALER
ncbi:MULTISPECIES: class I SAM-dependent methyltransferase [Pseudoclavibacter]|uniref:Class I SAM-dependent methyltransferase n=1 Tax=Pseudoclavibacter terrae TaxID=1530195 RepID=A0A7J5AYA2_9MICO|nr:MULTISPECIES: class I SAM-dependent methyltransferase [Pseudoclavibacter]KAB1636461.1 class I SAM-dependent methyltransferase [Pseudoclavibacter terrae]PPG40020.1 SAM-dependent methyltransferase [Pseudoclavibacter sp. RFBA6]